MQFTIICIDYDRLCVVYLIYQECCYIQIYLLRNLYGIVPLVFCLDKFLL